jgi:16S rRNA (cytosine1402-N4)-methyltransferase
LVHEIVNIFRAQSTILDCTLGGGGHAQALLEGGAQVTGIDRDPEALATASKRLSQYVAKSTFRAVRGDFTKLDELEALAGLSFGGILADLGISSHQIDDDARGFSFRLGVPLDMRMSGSGMTAADLLNDSPPESLSTMFRDYGDEPRARRLAAEVVRRRENRPFVIADDLVGAIRGALGKQTGPRDCFSQSESP